MHDWEKVKKELGKKAADLAPHKGIIGLGSGTTSEWFIRALAEKFHKKPSHITCIATSTKSETLAIELGLPIVPFKVWQKEIIDFLVDGADCVDPKGNMIKGLGGALLREKLIAHAAKRYIILVDERKMQPQLQGIVPIEILPQGIPHTISRIEQLGYQGTLREISPNVLFTTDAGNVIFDLQLQEPLLEPSFDETRLKNVAGVVETGLFLGMKPELIIGHP